MLKFPRRVSRRSWFLPCLTILSFAWLAAAFGSVAAKTAPAQQVPLTPIEQLGKRVFFAKISTPKRMACVTCHLPEMGGTAGVSGVNVHEVAITGANPHTIGNLKPPTNTYASLIETFKPCNRGGLFALNVCGGNFWNGRAEGNTFAGAVFPAGATKHIGEEILLTTAGAALPLPSTVLDTYRSYFGPTADQALNPMPNVVEQNIDRRSVCQFVESSKFATLYEEVWGVPVDCTATAVVVSAPDTDPSVNTNADPAFFPERAFDISFKRLMLAVAAWQASADLNSFSSKRDIALAADADGRFPLDGLTAEENLGHDLFYNTLPVPFIPEAGFNVRPFPSLPITNCSFCHSSDRRTRLSPGQLGTDPFERYADDAYHIIGIPRNPEIPQTFAPDGTLNDPDLGLKGHAGAAYPPGFFKTPTLRNVDKRRGVGSIKAYGHNGWFKSMESIVHFYNTSFIEGDTANAYGVTRCPAEVETEFDALALNCWPAPAYPGASPVLVGNLHLTLEEEAALVAYLKTLTDTYTPTAPNDARRP